MERKRAWSTVQPSTSAIMDMSVFFRCGVTIGPTVLPVSKPSASTSSGLGVFFFFAPALPGAVLVAQRASRLFAKA